MYTCYSKMILKAQKREQHKQAYIRIKMHLPGLPQIKDLIYLLGL